MDEKFEEVNKMITIAPEGLGYGKGQISVQNRINDPSDPLTEEVTAQVAEIIDPADHMQRIDDASDGCPDGRKTKRLLVDGKILEKAANRMKVFGGGLTMGVAGLAGTGKVANESLTDVYGESQSMFQRNGRDYGAHSADHAHGENCGCGAIDSAPEIWNSAVEFRTQITDSIMAIAASQDEAISLRDRIDAVYENITEFNDYQNINVETYSGRKVMENIADNGKVIAELTGEHKEVRVVVNVDIEDHTFNQAIVRDSTNDEAQVFAIDVPRMRSIATMFESEEDRTNALLSMFIYSFATAATLTKGDLPVDFVYRDSHVVDFSAHEFAALQA
ncbi:MAG: hypothetical protein ACR2FM_03435 [Candidatus Saccharimonadales bacterium]